MEPQLFQGDCLDILPTLPACSVDLCILDLPYGQTALHWDTRVDLGALWTQLKRIGKPNTAFIFFTTTRFGYELIGANPEWFRYDIVWEKNTKCGFLNARQQPMRSHEMIYVFYKKQPTYDIQGNHTRILDVEYENGATSRIYGAAHKYKQRWSIWEPRLPVSILKIDVDNNTKSNRLHNTQKPVALLEWLIKYYSKVGDTIVDPTMGSGTTGVAARNLQRRFIGIEKDSTIYAVAKNRIENHKPETPN